MIPIFDNSVYEWGMNLIIAIQKIQNDFLTMVMQAISLFSDPLFYVFFMVVLFWCIDEKKGFKVGMLILFSASLNSSLKNFLQVPRPYVENPTVAIGDTHGFSTPSGHSQGSAVFYPYIATLLPLQNKKQASKRACKLLFALAIPFVIGFSRVYLGVHYPSDVLLGWTIGFLISAGAILFFPLIEKKLASLRYSLKILIVAIIALILNYIGPHDTSMAGLFLGFGAGYIFLLEKGGFDAATGIFWQKLLRVTSGILVMGLVYSILKLVLPGEESANYQLYKFLRYTCVGFFGSFVLPKLFIAMRIALPRKQEVTHE